MKGRTRGLLGARVLSGAAWLLLTGVILISAGCPLLIQLGLAVVGLIALRRQIAAEQRSDGAAAPPPKVA